MDINANNTTQFGLKAEPIAVDFKKGQLVNPQNQKSNVADENKQSDSSNLKVESLSKVEEKHQLDKVADNLTSLVSAMQKGLKFSVDEESGKQVIKVQEIESGDVIRQIPSEEALQLAEKLSEVSGILMKIEV